MSSNLRFQSESLSFQTSRNHIHSPASIRSRQRIERFDMFDSAQLFGNVPRGQLFLAMAEGGAGAHIGCSILPQMAKSPTQLWQRYVG